jgi:hypothetical protein
MAYGVQGLLLPYGRCLETTRIRCAAGAWDTHVWDSASYSHCTDKGCHELVSYNKAKGEGEGGADAGRCRVFCKSKSKYSIPRYRVICIE